MCDQLLTKIKTNKHNHSHNELTLLNEEVIITLLSFKTQEKTHNMLQIDTESMLLEL